MAGIKRSGILFTLVGPAGSGKTTVASRIIQEFKPSVRLSVSVTSRTPRVGEIDGVHYHFVSREVFKQKVAAGEFFEWEETHGNFYGTLIQTLEDAIATSVDLVLDIDIRGALNFKRQYSDNTVVIFMLPPSKEVLVERIKNRGAVSDQELEKRLKTARDEYASFELNKSLIDYTIVNDSLEETYEKARSALIAERCRLRRLTAEDLKSLLKI